MKTKSISLKKALKALMETSEKRPKSLGALLYSTDETGHTLLCRLLCNVAHYGPSGTFVTIAHVNLEAGGSLCAFGVQCGKPSESYMQQIHERAEEFQRIHRILKASGALVAMVWENPRFSSAGLCKCGRSDERKLPLHDPLCPYRVEHGIPVTVEEYRKALGRLQ